VFPEASSDGELKRMAVAAQALRAVFLRRMNSGSGHAVMTVRALRPWAGRTEIGYNRSSCWTAIARAPDHPVAANEMTRRGFWAVACFYLVVSMGATLQGPLYALYQARWHFSAFVLTSIYAAFPIGVLVSLILFGDLADRIGRRPVLVATALLAAVSTVGFLLADGVAVLYAGRVISGLASGLAQGAATAALIDLAPRHRRRRAAVVTTAVTLGGFALGGLVAGVVTTLAPAPLESVYVVYLILLLAATRGFDRIPPAAEPALRRPLLRPAPVSLPPVHRGGVVAAGVSATAALALLGFYASVVSIYLRTSLNEPSHLISGAMVFAVYSAAVGAELALGRLTTRTVRVTGLFVLLAGVAALVIALDARSLLEFTFATFACGVGAGLTWMSGLATVSAMAVEHRADVFSTFYLIAYFGLVIPLVLAGAAMSWASPMEVVVGFSLVIAVLAGGGAGYLWRREAAALLIAELNPPAD
jgi:MFS family permease